MLLFQFFGFDIGYMTTFCEVKVKSFWYRCFMIQEWGPLTKTGDIRIDQPLLPYIKAIFCHSVDYNVDLIWSNPAVVVVIVKAKICHFRGKWANLFVIF